ncbi:TRAG family protein, partial [Bacillus thuringiensis]
MSEIYVGKMKNLGNLGEAVIRRKIALLPDELMQAISIAQTVNKPLKQHDYWIESATKLLAGSILY